MNALLSIKVLLVAIVSTSASYKTQINFLIFIRSLVLQFKFLALRVESRSFS